MTCSKKPRGRRLKKQLMLGFLVIGMVAGSSTMKAPWDQPIEPHSYSWRGKSDKDIVNKCEQVCGKGNFAGNWGYGLFGGSRNGPGVHRAYCQCKG